MGKKVLIGFAIFMGVIILFCVITVGSIWSHRNTAVKLEGRIEAQYLSNQSNYDNMWKKFKEMTQVTDLQAGQVKEVYTGMITGRYNDTNLLYQAVHEQNPRLATSVYTDLQREIAASRQQFDNNQKQMMDIVREYNTYIKVHFIMASLTNMKTYDMSQYIVTSDQTEDAFTKKKADEIRLK
ncbi:MULTISPECIES: hypothetical protein [Paenibacillus]|uniref:LemA family protein n=1 Tax=Paenibacillus terrae (strain HPL-003) TaxID=985665 RepID=G7W422_PAETH|nr:MULTISPECIES: hypothetical protein [Paenibacillus]AET59262.1 hypothetical protein HPL003_12535 [Paenibacillus terrae HPL-003]